ncbi:MAG: sigma-70 family RNA polymerase sigma factor [Actinomycetes bacterium]
MSPDVLAADEDRAALDRAPVGGRVDPLRPVDPAEEERLVREGLPLVGYLVSELMGRLPSHINREDLTSAGLAALAQSARGYDPSREVPFTRFASARIRGGLLDELRTLDWASRSVRARARQRDMAVDQLTAALGRAPSATELAESLGVRVQEVDAVEVDLARAVVLSLQGFSASSEVDALVAEPGPGPEESLLTRERVGYLHDAIDLLPERLRTVVEQYFFDDRPMAAIAADLGVTESRVSQMRAEALSLLREAMLVGLEPERRAEQPALGCAVRRREAYCAAVVAHGDLRSRLAVRPRSMGAPGSGAGTSTAVRISA